MPVRRYRLTRTEQDEQFEVAQVLRAQGVAIDIPEEWEKQSRCLEISVSPESTIYVHRYGVPLYTIYIRCTSLRNNLILDGFEITPAWDDDIIECTSEKESYRFTGNLNFDFTEVLNHQLEARLRFPRIGDRVEGWLLAQGMKPVPAEYGPRHPAPFELSLWDHLGHICSTHSVAMVDRSAQIRETHVRRRDSLYAGPTSTSSEARETGVLHDSYGSEFSRFRSRRNRETVDTETTISKKTAASRALDGS